MSSSHKLPNHDWTISITLREDLNLSHLASDGVDLLDKDVILQGLAGFLEFPEGVGLSVVKCEIAGPLLARPLKTGEDIVQGMIAKHAAKAEVEQVFSPRSEHKFVGRLDRGCEAQVEGQECGLPDRAICHVWEKSE